VDALYGVRSQLFLSDIKVKKFKLSKSEDEERAIMPRCTLHAFSLGLKHPVTNEDLFFECPAPKDFQATIMQLNKWGK
jgi:23S rRNA-/tRNA-specific pseudouridylate synthase